MFERDPYPIMRLKCALYGRYRDEKKLRALMRQKEYRDAYLTITGKEYSK